MQYILPVLLFVSSFSYGQKVFLGIGGGYSHSTAASAVSKQLVDNYLIKPDKINGGNCLTFFFKGGIELHRFQIGLKAEYNEINYSFSMNYGSGFTTKSVSSMPFVMPCAFANYKISLPRSLLYFGINAGYGLGKKENAKISLNYNGFSVTDERAFVKKPQLVFGSQVGYRVKLANGVHLQAELSANCMLFKSDILVFDFNAQPRSINANSHVFYFPATIGITQTL